MSRILNYLKKLTERFWSGCNERSIYIGDLLQSSCNVLTYYQYVTVSRIIDLQSFRNGDKNFFWQNRITDATNTGGGYTERQKIDDNKRFEILINSLDSDGFNPNIDRIHLATKNGLYAIEGSHRQAWCYESKNHFVPVRFIHSEIRENLLDGKKFLGEKGLSLDELRILDNKYNEIMKSLHTGVLCILSNDKMGEILPMISEYGELEDYVYDSAKYYDLGSKQIQKTSDYCLKKLNLSSQSLYVKKNKIVSKPIMEISLKLKKFDNWGYIAHSVTESICIESMLKE